MNGPERFPQAVHTTCADAATAAPAHAVIAPGADLGGMTYEQACQALADAVQQLRDGRHGTGPLVDAVAVLLEQFDIGAHGPGQPATEDASCYRCGGTGEEYLGTGPDGHAWSGEECCCSHPHCECGDCGGWPCAGVEGVLRVALAILAPVTGADRQGPAGGRTAALEEGAAELLRLADATEAAVANRYGPASGIGPGAAEMVRECARTLLDMRGAAAAPLPEAETSAAAAGCGYGIEAEPGGAEFDCVNAAAHDIPFGCVLRVVAQRETAPPAGTLAFRERLTAALAEADGDTDWVAIPAERRAVLLEGYRPQVDAVLSVVAAGRGPTVPDGNAGPLAESADG